MLDEIPSTVVLRVLTASPLLVIEVVRLSILVEIVFTLSLIVSVVAAIFSIPVSMLFNLAEVITSPLAQLFLV